MIDKTSANAGGVREAIVQHTYNVPREVVFAAWTDQALVKQWWGPHGFSNPVCELDVRPGGKIRIHMQSPDGTVYPVVGTYHEVIPPQRIVFTSSALDEDGNTMFEVLQTVTFAEQAGRTTVTITGRVTTTNVSAVAEGYLEGMSAGMKQQLERLETFLKKPEPDIQRSKMS